MTTSSAVEGLAIQVPSLSRVPRSRWMSSDPAAWIRVIRSPGRRRPRVLPTIRQRPSGLDSMNRPSQCPPVLARRPTSRAGMTRVSLITRQSGRRRKFGQVADVLVLQRVAAAIDHHQPGIAAANRRRLGNQPLRQLVVVVGQFGHHWIIVGELWWRRQGEGERGEGRGERRPSCSAIRLAIIGTIDHKACVMRSVTLLRRVIGLLAIALGLIFIGIAIWLFRDAGRILVGSGVLGVLGTVGITMVSRVFHFYYRKQIGPPQC